VALQRLFEDHRGRCYTKVISFPLLVNLIADALLEHQGSANRSFEHAIDRVAVARRRHPRRAGAGRRRRRERR
jgi:hypothetical protein